MLTGLQWYGHASVRFEAGANAVFVDPYQIAAAGPANVMLITHSHFDHLSMDDVQKLRAPGCVTVAPADCVEQLGGDTRVIAPGDRMDLGNGVVVEAHPSYNTNKQFHPRANGWVGYVIEMEGRRVYVAGDTDHIPEMKDVRCDVAFMPVGGTYTMTAEEAAAAVKDVDPKLAVPIHWGTIVGSRQDAERFVGLCGDRGRLLEPQKS